MYNNFDACFYLMPTHNGFLVAEPQSTSENDWSSHSQNHSGDLRGVAGGDGIKHLYSGCVVNAMAAFIKYLLLLICMDITVS